ncbi:hypothetical protein FW774_19270 [Pedobacter sp. BS3]|uniref:hypothetical protein n=1 Tax=Pedobacter sp. BS3 TaxID=2567937 RepID=UPI0011EE8F7F|nr:hypothetical protein [Pedobacter sp. BS3]TZF81190.1 hypothetical protein FW774_19270 [Pedobacter sp. BS3]
MKPVGFYPYTRVAFVFIFLLNIAAILGALFTHEQLLLFVAITLSLLQLAAYHYLQRRKLISRHFDRLRRRSSLP